MKKYIYNKGTGTLHIEGFCPYARTRHNDERFMVFTSENEALSYDGCGVRWCKNCHAKKEQIVKYAKM